MYSFRSTQQDGKHYPSDGCAIAAVATSCFTGAQSTDKWTYFLMLCPLVVWCLAEPTIGWTSHGCQEERLLYSLASHIVLLLANSTLKVVVVCVLPLSYPT